MSKTGISDEVRFFIIDSIDSIGQLEVLLLLHSNPNKRWTSSTVGEETRSSEFAAEGHLEILYSRGILSKEAHSVPIYAYAPKQKTLLKTVDELANAYSTYRVAIITLIYNKPIDAIRSFSNAFKIRKDN